MSKPPVFNFGRLEQNRPFMAWAVLTISRLGGVAIAYVVICLIWPAAVHPKDVVPVMLSLSAIDFWRIAYPSFEKESLWKRVAVGAAIGLLMWLIFNYATFGYRFFGSFIG